MKLGKLSRYEQFQDVSKVILRLFSLVTANTMWRYVALWKAELHKSLRMTSAVGHPRFRTQQPLWVRSPPVTDILRVGWHVRFVPKTRRFRQSAAGVCTRQLYGVSSIDIKSIF
jgi:hypothetical protein